MHEARTETTKRIEHEFTYPKGQGILEDEAVLRDAEAQRGVFAKDLGGADLVTIERVGEKSNGGFYTFRATYDVPTGTGRLSEDYALGGPKNRVLVPLVDGDPTMIPFEPEGTDRPQGQPMGHPNTVVTTEEIADMERRTQEATPGEPVSELGHTEDQVRQIREGGPVPEPDGKPDPDFAPSTAVSAGDDGTTTTTTTAAPKRSSTRKSSARAASTTTTDRPERTADTSTTTATPTTTTTAAPRR